MRAAGCPKHRRALWALVVAPLVAGWSPGIAAAMAQDADLAPTDRFASEPRRTRADAPIRFSRSWDEARAEAKATGRRLLAYFTGEHCGWCRELERRTFTDAEVVALSQQFVCVEVHIGEEKNQRLSDKYGIDSIPRSLVFTPGEAVIDRRTGYLPAAEYAAWLKGVGTTPPAPAAEGDQKVAPAPVGALQDLADVVIWSVDAEKNMARWKDGDWTGHAHLIALLRAAGLRPRVEHMARDQFADRWDDGADQGHLPEIIVADKWAGLLRDLDAKGRLIAVRSQRLTWMTESASCADLAGRWVFLVAGSPHESEGRKAVDELLKPGPETSLPGTEMPEEAGRAEAVSVARRAVIAYVSGDPERLKRWASASSPQLSRCTRPPEYRRGWDVDAGPVEVRGNGTIAFARVEMRSRGKNIIGADPVLVVLRREGSHWKAFSVGDDVFCLRALPALCRLELRTRSGTTAAPPIPRLLRPMTTHRSQGPAGRSPGRSPPGPSRSPPRSARSSWMIGAAVGR